MESIFKVDISPIKDQPGQTIEIQGKIVLPNLTGVGDRLLEFINPWELELQVTNINQGFQVKGKMAGSYEMICDRCLEKVRSYLETEITDNFLPANNSCEKEDGDKIYLGDELDLTETLLETINLKIPMKNLCSPDCQGLCLVCGLNLNTQTCKCQQDVFDPRLANLLKWKEQEGGGSDGQSKR